MAQMASTDMAAAPALAEEEWAAVLAALVTMTLYLNVENNFSLNLQSFSPRFPEKTFAFVFTLRKPTTTFDCPKFHSVQNFIKAPFAVRFRVVSVTASSWPPAETFSKQVQYVLQVEGFSMRPPLYAFTLFCVCVIKR